MKYSIFVYDTLKEMKDKLYKMSKSKKLKISKKEIKKTEELIRKVENLINKCMNDPSIRKKVDEYGDFSALERCADTDDEKVRALVEYIVFNAAALSLKKLNQRGS